MEFVGPAVRLTDADIAATAATLGIEPAVVHAVDEVESRGHGFLDDGRPTILFERHVFSRRTGHRFDGIHPGISDVEAGGYGAAGAHQYDRLHEATALDRAAALQSASWGRYQVMGFNATSAGWVDVESFVASMCESEAEHLKAFVGYCQANDLIRFLAVHDWRSFTRGYNGSGNVDDYAPKLEAAYRRHAAGPKPVPGTDWADQANDPMRPGDAVKEIQKTLVAAGVYPADRVDGAFGRRSRAALNALLRAAGQPGL